MSRTAPCHSSSDMGPSMSSRLRSIEARCWQEPGELLMKSLFETKMELYGGGGPKRLPSDDDVLSSAPFKEVQEHFRIKAEEQRELKQQEARASAERMLLVWTSRR